MINLNESQQDKILELLIDEMTDEQKEVFFAEIKAGVIEKLSQNIIEERIKILDMTLGDFSFISVMQASQLCGIKDTTFRKHYSEYITKLEGTAAQIQWGTFKKIINDRTGI